ncbi:YHS domain-containing (seleno)protein [Reyranella sp.]|uniref:YHS domain-containing (seleno)protein n=1 Tax=Reyranella sp. TaxID=1929291 RepID=UPI0040372830
MSMRRAVLRGMGATLVGGLAGASAAWAQPNRASTARLGLKGYDPVAYFTLSAPTPGSADYELVWDGVRYRFVSARHRDLFRADPDKYSPQFGGQCAMNMANGNLRESDPTIWTISNGRLYVFASAAGSERFRESPGPNATRANGNWQNLRKTTGQ